MKMVAAWLVAGVLLLFAGYLLRLKEVATVMEIARQKLAGVKS
jgi:hypothetical protein